MPHTITKRNHDCQAGRSAAEDGTVFAAAVGVACAVLPRVPEPEPEGDTVTPANPVQHAPQPFGEFARSVSAQAGLRAAITRHYRAPEMECLPRLFSEARPADRAAVRALAEKLVHALRRKQSGVGVDALIHEFALSTQEGVALMCLAEALLRIPDTATRDALIRDKIAQGNWRAYLGESPSLFVNAAMGALRHGG